MVARVAPVAGKVARSVEARSGLDPWVLAELPAPPAPTGLGWLAVVGPGVIVLGASIGGGEFLLGPAVFVRHGLSLLWVTGIAIWFQTIFNTELMRYTLATGEPVFTGFMRTRPSSRLWAVFYAVLFFLQVGWVAPLVQDAFDDHPDLCAGTLSERPVDRHAFSDHLDQFGGDEFQFVVAHRLDGGFIGGQSVVERNFVIGKAQFFAAFGSGVHFLCQANQFLDHFMRRDRPVVVGVQGLLQFVGEQLRLHQVAF